MSSKIEAFLIEPSKEEEKLPADHSASAMDKNAY